MISILLLDNQIEEAKILQEDLRDLTAKNSDERLEFTVLPDAAGLPAVLKKQDLLHVAVVDVTCTEGTEAARAIRSRYPEAQLLVIADAAVSPLSYLTPAIRPGSLLLRPFGKEQRKRILEDFFFLAVKPLMKEDDAVFWARTKEGTQKIPYHAVLYFEAREKKVFVRTRRMEYGTGGTIEALAEKLPDQFVRCHRSYIINRDYLERIRLSEGIACLTDQITVPISRSYKAQMKGLTAG